jgi:hypothetical protein
MIPQTQIKHDKPCIQTRGQKLTAQTGQMDPNLPSFQKYDLI